MSNYLSTKHEFASISPASTTTKKNFAAPLEKQKPLAEEAKMFSGGYADGEIFLRYFLVGNLSKHSFEKVIEFLVI